MNIILFDDAVIRKSLLPLTYTRPVAEIRIGILKISEKWAKHLDSNVSFQTEEYLSRKFIKETAEENLFINGALCPNEKLLQAISKLVLGEVLTKDGQLLAAKCTELNEENNDSLKQIDYTQEAILIDEVYKIFKQNASQLELDFKLITKGRTSANITDLHTIVYGKENLFIEEGASIKAAIINAENGPVYIGKNCHIHEGAIIKGSFAMCEGSHVNMGAKIKGDTTIGPFSKVGGEVSNSILLGYSNKGHDGFLGNSIVGQWCNLGADTNTSNLKNNYDSVKLWNYEKGGFKNTGEQFCGLIMGDHSKAGINTMFNTGTVVGVSANIFGSGFPRNFLPSFSWGGAAGLTTFQKNKADEVAEKVMARRNIEYSEIDKAIMQHIFEGTAQYRIWDKG